MMTYFTRAGELLGRTESALRGLVAEAISAGDYDAVVQLASWARSVGELVQEVSTDVRPGATLDRATVGPRDPSKALRSARRGKSSTKDEYPRFYRKGDRLVRVAWSKREKKEYEHKAPHSVLRSLTASIIEKGVAGRVFSTDDVLPIYDDDGAPVPSYQAYVGIALLKQTGLLDQHGRQGYSMPQPHDLESAVEAVWRNLPEDKKTRS
jgi:hypothetical protein